MKNHEHGHETELTIPKTPWTDWLPLMVVVAYIFGLTAVTAKLTEYSTDNVLAYSMGYFFIIFSLFKMINLKGFAEGYHEYDIISRRWYGWGYIVPFIELAIGVLYVSKMTSVSLNLFTIIFSLIVVVGVGIKLAKKEKFVCACLGTVLKVPLTKVSLVEYLVMAITALAMIVR